MKNYVRKKLPNFRVHRVLSSFENRREEMRQIDRPFIVDGVPTGCYVVAQNAILFPKKRRGEKFIVNYTVMEEAIL